MKLLIDNTGLHAVGRCLRKSGKSETDLDGLLQFSSQLVLCDQVLVSTFETEGIRKTSQEIRDALVHLGLEGDPLTLLDIEKSTFRKCCLSAADRLASHLSFCLEQDPLPRADLEIAVPDLQGGDEETFREVHSALTDGLTESERQDILDRAFEERQNPAQIFMLAASDRLWTQARIMSRAKTWTMDDTYRFVVYQRYHLNEDLARAHAAIYNPAVSRGRLMKQRSGYILSRLDEIVGEAVTDLRSLPSPHPSIVNALAIRSKGEHKGLIAEIQHARSVAAPLRDYLRSRATIVSDDNDEIAALREDNETIMDLKHLLRKDLGLDQRPLLRAAFEIQLFGFVPLPSFVKLVEWSSFARARKRVSVLSEFALTLSCSDLDPYSIGQLRQSSLR